MLSTVRNNDRFITSHSNAAFPISSQSNSNTSTYDQYIKNNLLSSSRLLNYTQKQQPSTISTCADLFSGSASKKCQSQRFQAKSEKVLDAPNYRDDFYLNNLDWSSKGCLGIALNTQVYLYSPKYTILVTECPDDLYVSSVKFIDSMLSVALSDGVIQLFDLEKNVKLRQIYEHEKRIATQQFSNNLLLTGSKDRSIVFHDLKLKNTGIKKFKEHKGEVCSLTSHSNILASGGNDNQAILWDLRKHSKLHKFKGHQGAVKALSWCPWRNGVLASGAGAGDRTIRIWNTNQNSCIGMRKTEAQVSGLAWNSSLQTLISSHGHPDNEIKFWKVNGENELKKICELKGHERRILQMVQAPAEDYLCTVGADESLRLWNLNPSSESQSFVDPLKKDRWSFRLK